MLELYTTLTYTHSLTHTHTATRDWGAYSCIYIHIHSSREGFLDESARRVLEFGKCQMVITNLYERSRSNALVKGKV